MSKYKVTEKYLKILNQSFQTKQMQRATITLDIVGSHKHCLVLGRPENVSNSPITRFFPESHERFQNSKTFLKLKMSQFHTSHKLFIYIKLVMSARLPFF